jgi:parallel beta-helix repeat protein
LFVVVTFYSSLVFASTAYYVDCSARSNGNGSFLRPWNNIAPVNSYNFKTGDDVYFKAGKTCTFSDRLKIDWKGTDSDRVIIGAYSGKNDFTLSENARPIISGSINTVPTYESYQALIERQLSTQGDGYITVENLRLEYSGSYAILFKKTSNVRVENCYIYRPKRQGIVFVRVYSGTIDGNIVEEASYHRSPGAGIEVSGANASNSTYDITISRNKVFHSYEGIGLYKMTRNCIVENNVLYDNRSYQIYIDAGKDNVVRRNVIYGSTEWADWKSSKREWASAAILVEVEQERCDQKPGSYPYGDSNKIYGNFIANTKYGIALLSGCDSFVQTNNKIYDNRIIGCGYNFRFADDAGWSGNEVYNNVSLNFSDGVRTSRHSNDYSPSGVTWSANNFSGSVSGNAAINARIYIPELNKSSGWHSIEPGTADGTEWMEKGSETDTLNPPQALSIVVN